MQESIHASPDYRELFKFMNFMEKTALENHLQTMVECLCNSSLKAAKDATAKAKQFIVEIKELESEQPHANGGGSTKVTTHPLSSPPSGQKKKLDRFQLEEALLAQAKEAKAAKQSPFERLRARVTEFYHQTFKAALASPTRTQVPLHEVFIFNDCEMVAARLQGTPRTALQKSLQAPHFYIQVRSPAAVGIFPNCPHHCHSLP